MRAKVIAVIALIASVVLIGVATTNIVDHTYQQAYEQGWTDGANKILDNYLIAPDTVAYKNQL